MTAVSADGDGKTQLAIICHTNAAGAHDLQRGGRRWGGHPELLAPGEVPPIQRQVNRKRLTQVAGPCRQGREAARPTPVLHHVEPHLGPHRAE